MDSYFANLKLVGKRQKSVWCTPTHSISIDFGSIGKGMRDYKGFSRAGRESGGNCRGLIGIREIDFSLGY